mmetsp:Transcript_15137/g.47077  ORF Transcript_15137/g.47077 Transcript_15137/m.47077 type:complete len:214 (+) Transcript_15137:109-750(+)
MILLEVLHFEHLDFEGDGRARCDLPPALHAVAHIRRHLHQPLAALAHARKCQEECGGRLGAGIAVVEPVGTLRRRGGLLLWHAVALARELVLCRLAALHRERRRHLAALAALLAAVAAQQLAAALGAQSRHWLAVYSHQSRVKRHARLLRRRAEVHLQNVLLACGEILLQLDANAGDVVLGGLDGKLGRDKAVAEVHGLLQRGIAPDEAPLAR